MLVLRSDWPDTLSGLLPASSTLSHANQILLHDYRDVTFMVLSSVSTGFALNPTSTLIPSVLALATFHSYARFLFPSVSSTWNTFFFTLAIAAGSASPNLTASQEALDTKAISFVLLTCVSIFTSAIVVGALYVDWQVTRKYPGLSALFFFPALWTTIWRTVAYLSPVGNYLTWTRPNVLEGYKWLIPVVGPASQDWITAAWAVVCSQVFQSWFMGPQITDSESESEDDTSQAKIKSTRSPSTHVLALGLSALLVPSLFITNFPLPIADLDTTTSFGVGCILPTFQRYKHHALTLKDYINESKKFQNSAKFLLWPEGAVQFASDEERDAAFTEVRANITGAYVGLSFEQTAADPSDPSRRKGYKRTGIAVIHKDSPDPYLLYYKRHLVPIAESYQLSRSLAPPTLANLSLSTPKDVPPSRWDPSPSHSRSLTVTASVCLDFAFPDPFHDLPSRPGLILAPARTWERSVGISMWLQAKQRAVELDSLVLWCDGGESGVSGVGGGGFEDVQQIGRGSWVKNIGVQYPFDPRRTAYARLEDLSVLVYWFMSIILIIAKVFRRRGRAVALVQDPERPDTSRLIDI